MYTNNFYWKSEKEFFCDTHLKLLYCKLYVTSSDCKLEVKLARMKSNSKNDLNIECLKSLNGVCVEK